MQKKQRHELIIHLVSTQYLATQQDLIEALKEHQVVATQSSMSRDIKSLGLIKKGGRYQCQTLIQGSPIKALDKQHRSYIKNIELVGSHLIVVKTQPATAQTIAASFDRLNWPEIAGTIAGDDTVFMAIRSEDQAALLLRRLYHQS